MRFQKRKKKYWSFQWNGGAQANIIDPYGVFIDVMMKQQKEREIHQMIEKQCPEINDKCLDVIVN